MGIVGDSIITGNGAATVSVLFEVRFRLQAATNDRQDQVLASVQHTFTRDAGRPFAAIQFSTTVPSTAAAAAIGDLLVYRMTLVSADAGALFIPNGDGSNAEGNIPRLDLPH